MYTYTKKGLLISISIVLMVSIAIGFCGVDSSMKTQLQNAVGKDGEPCYDIREEDCGPEGGSDECKYCNIGLTEGGTADCILEGDVLSDDTYNICYGTSEDKYCRFNHTVSCGYRYFCRSNYIHDDMRCDDEDGECHYSLGYPYCRQCIRDDPKPWPSGEITAHDELCQ